MNIEFYPTKKHKYEKWSLDDKQPHTRCYFSNFFCRICYLGLLIGLFTCGIVRYGRTVTDGQKNHPEINDNETSKTMCHLVPFLFLVVYIAPQKYIVHHDNRNKEN